MVNILDVKYKGIPMRIEYRYDLLTDFWSWWVVVKGVDITKLLSLEATKYVEFKVMEDIGERYDRYFY